MVNRQSKLLRSRWASLPGVSFPEESKPKPKPKDLPSIAEVDASVWMSSRAAAELLGCTGAAARSRLHRQRADFKLVRTAKGGTALVWRRAAVEASAARMPAIRRPRAGWLTAKQACRALGVARSQLHRYTHEQGVLRPLRTRVRTSCGLRTALFYDPREVEILEKARQKCENAQKALHALRPLPNDK